MKNIFFLMLVSFGIVAGAKAQFSISAEYRPRLEINRGYVNLPVDTSQTQVYITHRARLNFNYAMEKFSFRLSMQDIRTWGDGDVASKTGVFGSTRGIDIYEAWMSWHMNEKSYLRLGRQEIRIDDERLISWRNWNQWGLTYDAVRYNYAYDGWEFNAVGSYNNRDMHFGAPSLAGEDYYTSVNRIKTQNFLHLKRRFSHRFSASLIALGTGFLSPDQPNTIYMMGTYGVWMGAKAGGFDGTLNAYYQNGMSQTGKEISAFMFTVNPGYNIGNVRIGAGLDYISGDDAESDDYGQKVKTFNKMYGTQFKYYGWMNYFTFMQGSTKNGGLLDIYPNLQIALAKKHKLAAYYHLFSLANPVMLSSGVEDDLSLGSEIDLMYTYKPSTEVTLQAGFSYYLVSDTMEKIKGIGVGNAETPYWAWVMITFKPVLFTSK
ncbi:MAG: alginate export family protein [Bacteroidales bacterium]